MRSSTRCLLLTATFAMIASPRIADASCIPGFDFAAFGKDGVPVGGTSTGTDGYNSSVGAYTVSATTTSGGNIGTNSTTCSSIDFNGNPTIGGDVKYGAGSSCPTPSGGTVTGTTSAQTVNQSMTSVTFPATVGVVQGNISGTVTVTSTPNNTYGKGDVGNGETMTLAGGVYIFDSWDVKGTVKVTAASVVYFKCSIRTNAVNMNNGLLNPNPTQVASTLVLMLGPNCATAEFNGGTNTAFAVYGPDTAIKITGGNDIYGAVVGKTIDLGGNTKLHYDRALANFTTGNFTCPAEEVSRASPVVAFLNSGVAHVVQGTYEVATGAQTQITDIASIATWSFPYLKGHMRARVASSITTTSTGYSSGTIYFDAGATGKIPTPNYSGCSSFNGSCRHVFTNTNSDAATGTTFHPSTSVLADGTSAAIGALIAPASVVTGIAAAQWQTIVRKVLDAKLGGVDRATVAVIEASSYAGTSTRPTMAYFGAADGMLHAVCAQAGGRTASSPSADICPSAGTELWAFLPRVQLPLIRTNSARIDGSVRVADVFGDFTNNPATGTKSWHTILTFQTGYSINSKAAVYAFDITDPANPTLLWEYTAPTTSPTATELGTGLIVSMASPYLKGVLTNMVVAQTNNGGTGTAGVVAVALSQETGERLWKFGDVYPTVPRGVAADGPLPTSPIPGGAVGVDSDGENFITDFVMGDIYGRIWQLSAIDGSSRNGSGTPLFSFSTNKHPFGAPPAIYKKSGNLYAAIASGGYVDPVATVWTTSQQYLIAAKLSYTGTTVTEATAATSTGPIGINTALTSGYMSFSQAMVVGTQLFVTADSSDINLATYGTGTSQTGRLRTVDLQTGTSSTTVITSGATSLAYNSAANSLYSSSRNQQELLAAAPTNQNGGEKVDLEAAPQMTRNLWLRSE